MGQDMIDQTGCKQVTVSPVTKCQENSVIYNYAGKHAGDHQIISVEEVSTVLLLVEMMANMTKISRFSVFTCFSLLHAV